MDERPGGPGSNGTDDPDATPERTSGLTLETCYRHPNELTGVHCTRCGRPICPECMTAAPVGYQCPECVREARRSAPRRRFRIQLILGRPGFMTSALLAVNIAMFLVEAVAGGGTLFDGPRGQTLFNLGALSPIAIAKTHIPGAPHYQFWRLITAMFLHIGLLHIAFNMYALYLFGFLIENAFGWKRFLAIYFVTGFLASVASFAFGPVGEIGAGASGAIFGLLGAWVAYNYRRRSSPIAYAQLRWAGFLIAINLVLSISIPGIDWRAHVGGLVAGIAAGAMAEGSGPRRVARLASAGGLIVLLLIGVAVTAWRVANFPIS
jgi:membrane associated rhomboid family serine protease